jgi:tetratricopeptide (TPR) repeat protein
MGKAYDRGLILYRQGRWAMALGEFRAELSADPGSVIGDAMLGMSHLQLKQYDAAEAEICEAARLGPDVGYTHFALAYRTLREHATWRVRSERRDLAREHLGQAIALEPFNLEHLALLAKVEADALQWPACLEAAERGLQALPGHER